MSSFSSSSTKLASEAEVTVVVVGDARVGKTSLIRRATGRDFHEVSRALADPYPTNVGDPSDTCEVSLRYTYFEAKIIALLVSISPADQCATLPWEEGHSHTSMPRAVLVG